MPLLSPGDAVPPVAVTLRPGDAFPPLAVTPVDADPIELPQAWHGHFGVLLFFRGAWCPYCNSQLRAFQRAGAKLAAADIKLAALSTDDEDAARDLVAKHELAFPVGHSADAVAIAEVTGAFLNPDPVFIQSTGFILDPDGRVVVSVYSSGAIGRLVPDDVVGMVSYVREHARD